LGISFIFDLHPFFFPSLFITMKTFGQKKQKKEQRRRRRRIHVPWSLTFGVRPKKRHFGDLKFHGHSYVFS
jgi:hypothetical protein